MNLFIINEKALFSIGKRASGYMDV